MLVLAGCSGPLWSFPGGALEGEEQEFTLDLIPSEGGVMQLETNPAEPYSVNIGFFAIAGNMYIDPAESRTWYQNIKQDPLVRFRFDGAQVVHLATAVTETEPSIVQQFEADRHVLKLVPREN